MNREGTIGAATLLALAAVVGISLQTGSRPEGGARPDQTSALKYAKPSTAIKISHPVGSACSSLAEQLEQFLDVEELAAPEPCYKAGDRPGEAVREAVVQRASQLKFVIATLPDPVHTHLPVLFDQFAVAIQEGAQDEKYDFDSSWLPWDDEETPYALFGDQKASDREKALKEEQPGIILFRKAIDCHGAKANRLDCLEDLSGAANKAKILSKPYREGLVVFVVGEEATQGIHQAQFRNALAWIEALKPKAGAEGNRVAILGPTFSGSFPSVVQVLSESETTKQLDLKPKPDGQRLAIYSGSVSSKDSATTFQNKLKSQVTFHSFVQNDDEILQRFCNYIMQEQPEFDVGRVAIISEDETAYGSKGVDEPASGSSEGASKDENKDCFSKALRLYYPRDISSLRGAYQTTSLFERGTSPQQVEIQKRSLPTNLADSSGKVQDSIRSYGGNQTPLTQEAFLLEIVAALRALNARYIFLRSSNTLDQLFLTNFLRRGYPDGRIVIFGSDLMFIRERGTTGLNGAMTLSTYPLFPLERDWTEHQASPAADRVFSMDTTEGTYVAFRLLLNDKTLNSGIQPNDRCHVHDQDEKRIFLPSIACTKDPIPDYSPPFWTLPNQCGEMADGNPQRIANQRDACPYPGPATWLSVIGSNRFWPMASLTSATPHAPPADKTKTGRMTKREKQPGGRPEIPVEMKVFLLMLVGFAIFHAWCCWSGSYTAKPAFRAHFASTGDWRHTFLVFSGSCCVAFLGIVAGWGCGLFSIPAAGLAYPWFGLGCVSFVCVTAWLAIRGNNRTTWKLAQDVSYCQGQPRMTEEELSTRNYLTSGLFIAALVLFCLGCILPVELVLLPENRVLTYWRAMHLASGVSPIVPILLVLAGLHLSFWFALHGLALFGPDRPRLPSEEQLTFKDAEGNRRCFLRMFSDDAAARIEQTVMPLRGKILPLGGAILFALFFAVACVLGGGVPVRSLGAESYSVIFLLCLDVCCTLAIVEACRLCRGWHELKRLLAFLDRLPLRRTLAALRGFSWGSVWKMSGNVLEVRYKVISRQMECMNHTISSLQEFLKRSSAPGVEDALASLTEMRAAGTDFAKWYSFKYVNPNAGDLSSFSNFQRSVAAASGTLLSKLLLPAWRTEEASLVLEITKEGKEEAAASPPPQAGERHIRNAEEFVCLNYLGFIQNILGRLRTMALTIMLLFLVATVATSTYPFDPRQALSAVLVILFVIVGAVIVKVYADMHRDSTLSHVTNTKPGELGTEFWLKIVGFGFAPLIGLLARIFPGMTDLIFSWLQPGISSLK
jgi:hypothetical protein